MGQLLLQSGTDITNWDSFYKVGKYLDQECIKGSSVRVLEWLVILLPSPVCSLHTKTHWGTYLRKSLRVKGLRLRVEL